MILNPRQAVAIALDEWHFWWPWIPIRLTCRDSHGKYNDRLWRWRWLYVVQRKVIYIDSDGGYAEAWTDYRDIIGRME